MQGIVKPTPGPGRSFCGCSWHGSPKLERIHTSSSRQQQKSILGPEGMFYMLGSKGENGWLSEDCSRQVNLIGAESAS